LIIGDTDAGLGTNVEPVWVVYQVNTGLVTPTAVTKVVKFIELPLHRDTGVVTLIFAVVETEVIVTVTGLRPVASAVPWQ
jgi:hypothetical protein